jgi:hypothetical protein
MCGYGNMKLFLELVEHVFLSLEEISPRNCGV